MDCSKPGFPVPHHLLAFAQVHVHWIGDVTQPSHPLSPSSPSALNLSQHQGFSNESALRIKWPKYWGFSFSTVLPKSTQVWFPLILTGLISLLGYRVLSHFTSVVSDSVRLYRQQPTRLPHPWDSPGKNTGVGCHFLLQCMKGKSESEVARSCPTPSDRMDCSPPGSSVHGILQAGVLEWGAVAFSKNDLVIYIFIYILFHIIFHCGLLQSSKYNSLCCTVRTLLFI